MRVSVIEIGEFYLGVNEIVETVKCSAMNKDFQVSHIEPW